MQMARWHFVNNEPSVRANSSALSPEYTLVVRMDECWTADSDNCSSMGATSSDGSCDTNFEMLRPKIHGQILTQWL